MLLNSVLERTDSAIVEKMHFAEAVPSSDGSQSEMTRIFALGGQTEVCTQELLLATDLLITDYSGCYVDFLVLNRPILHFAYDREYYEGSDRGLYFDLDEVAGGPVVTSFQDLCEAIKKSFVDQSFGEQQRSLATKILAERERGTASRAIVKRVFGNDP